jgi:outer membrane protein OmpA-like peptidoglycan-associated protein
MKKIILVTFLLFSTLFADTEKLNVTFDSKSYQVEEMQTKKLDKFVDFLFTNPQLSVILEGHADSIGTEKDNLVLSKHRAQTVKNYFILQGIIESRIKILACGETKPLAPNNIKEHRQINRRVVSKTFVTYQ